MLARSWCAWLLLGLFLSETVAFLSPANVLLPRDARRGWSARCLREKRFRAAPLSLRAATAEQILESVAPATAEELGSLMQRTDCVSVNGLRVILLGPPCSGKSQLAPILAEKYDIEQISIYDLVGEEAASDNKEIEKAIDRLCGDKRRGKGFVLHGYPMNIAQAKEMEKRGYEVDMVIELLRSDKEANEWREGRMVDGDTGLVYHSSLLKAPQNVAPRLEKKKSNTEKAFQESLKSYNKHAEELRSFFAGDLVQVDASIGRGVVDVLRDTTLALDSVCVLGDEIAVQSSDAMTAEGEVYKFIKGANKGIKSGGLLSHVKGLNSYDMADFVPFQVSGQQVGWLRKSFAELLDDSQRKTKTKAFEFQWPGCGIDGVPQMGCVSLDDSIAEETLDKKSEKVHKLIKWMWDEGLIRGWRGEMQSVSQEFNSQPVLQLERGAVPYFGVASYGVHVNIFTEDDDSNIHVWVARRAKDKPTYPGLLDQCVAGGQPADFGLQENVEKECIEEASISESLAKRAIPAGAVAYMYETRKGMSPKTLFCYDLKVPSSFVPINSDGEVDEFFRIPLSEMVQSISQHPEEWKPNSALVALEFAVRRGAINPDTEPDYLNIVKMLRGCK